MKTVILLRKICMKFIRISYEIYASDFCQAESFSFQSISDIDECKLGTHPCSQACLNIPGSYNCLCFFGFDLGDDRHTCEKSIIHMLFSIISICFKDNLILNVLIVIDILCIK